MRSGVGMRVQGGRGGSLIMQQSQACLGAWLAPTTRPRCCTRPSRSRRRPPAEAADRDVHTTRSSPPAVLFRGTTNLTRRIGRGESASVWSRVAPAVTELRSVLKFLNSDKKKRTDSARVYIPGRVTEKQP